MTLIYAYSSESCWILLSYSDRTCTDCYMTVNSMFQCILSFSVLLCCSQLTLTHCYIRSTTWPSTSKTLTQLMSTRHTLKSPLLTTTTTHQCSLPTARLWRSLRTWLSAQRCIVSRPPTGTLDSTDSLRTFHTCDRFSRLNSALLCLTSGLFHDVSASWTLILHRFYDCQSLSCIVLSQWNCIVVDWLIDWLR